MWDVAIVGSGPAGASCAAVCAAAGLRTLVLERAVFPREKVCGDCLNPTCWLVLERLGVAAEVRAAPQGKLDRVEFITVDGRSVSAPLPAGANAEIAIRRSVLDDILRRRASSLGAEVREGVTLLAVRREAETWTLETKHFSELAKLLVAADGRNSTVAQLCNLMPRKGRDRVALQTHVPIPADFGARIVLQLLREGYSGQAPVGDGLLNLCLVSRPRDLAAIKSWAEEKFAIPVEHNWRTVAPLARAALPPSSPGLFLVGDAARVVEPERPAAETKQASQTTHEHGVVRKGPRVVDQAIQQLLVAGRREAEPLPDRAVLRAPMLPPATLEIEQLAVPGKQSRHCPLGGRHAQQRTQQVRRFKHLHPPADSHEVSRETR